MYIRLLRTCNPQAVGVWNGQRYRQAIMVGAAHNLSIQVLFFENGLIHGMTTFDTHGVNFLNSMPRNPTIYLASKPRNVPQKHTVQHTLNEQQYNGKKYILVPFQVETDSQMLRFSPWIQNMAQLIEILITIQSALAPSWYFLCKKHPFEAKKHTWLLPKIQHQKQLQLADQKANMQQLLANAQAIITINSTTGIEGIMAHKKVIVLGQAFYALDGLCMQAHNTQELIQTIQNLHTWEQNAQLRQAFIQKLYQYQVPGNWRNADAVHLKAMTQRIIKTI